MTTDSVVLDTPQPVTVAFLASLDRQPSGTWLCQPKLDGWRRLVRLSGGVVYSTPRRGGTGDGRPLPPEIVRAVQDSPWLEGLGLDCEWVGPRRAGQPHSLHVFDLFSDQRFSERYVRLSLFPWPKKNLRLVPCWGNHGMVERFYEQLQDPASEGLVVRRADSRLVGGVNPLWFKVKFRAAERQVRHGV